MENIISQWLSADNINRAKGKTREEIFEMFGNELVPILSINPSYLQYLGDNICDNRVYSGMGYFINHVINYHPNKLQKIIVNYTLFIEMSKESLNEF